MLVYYECHDEMTSAIAREKQIKAGSRMKKLALIESLKSKLARFVRGLILSRLTESEANRPAHLSILDRFVSFASSR